MKLKRISQAVMLIGAVSIGQMAMAAESIEKIEVTGTSIKRIAKEGAIPVQQLKREDIQRTGATTVAELIQKLPAMQGFTIAPLAAGTNSGGRSSASIHAIGEDYTLVLLNGRRVAPFESGASVNLNSIPLSAVERVEVLTDGASALYGSDAIAGVVNFILKKRETGGNAEVSIDVPQEGGGESWNVNASYGLNLMDDRLNVLVSYRHEEQKLMKATDREFAKSARFPFYFNGHNYRYDKSSPNSIPANVDVEYKDAKGNLQSVSFNPYKRANNGACPQLTYESYNEPDKCIFDYASTVEILPENKRDNMYATANYKINDQFKLFSDLALTRLDLTAKIAPNAVPFSVDVGSDQYKKYILPYLTAEQAKGVTDISGGYRTFDWGGRASQTITDSAHFVFGGEADIAGWNLNSAITWSKNKLDERYVGGYMLDKEFREMMDKREFDPFAPIGQQSEATRAKIAKSIYNGSLRTASTTLKGIDGRASGELFQLPGGAANLGIGADYRELAFEQTPSDVAKKEMIYNVTAPDAYDLKRSNYGMFGELLLPLVKNLEVTVGARYDSISGVKSRFEQAGAMKEETVGERQSSGTYKVSMRYQPMPSLLLRSSYGTGFKTATMLDIARPLTEYGVTATPRSCPFAGNDPNGYCKPGLNTYQQLSVGNDKLKPEKSTQYTLGFRFEPSPLFSGGLDLWDVEIRDAVSSVSEDLAFSDPQRYRELFTTWKEQATGRVYWAFKDAKVNIGKQHNRGIDWDVSSRIKLDFGTLTNSFNGTYMIKADYTKAGTEEWTDSLGFFGIDDQVTFRTVAKFSTTLQTGAFTNSFTVNFRSGYTDASTKVLNLDTGKTEFVRLEVPTYSTIDWQGKYAVNKSLEVRAGIKNLFNREPPLSLRESSGHQVGFDPRYADMMLRTFYATASYKF
ncbi:TonB-dependent receptor [Parachitinimonas caeni]|uniref:TonB-dependent receptor n=1 Tax=Parachitinimonas caeni TaxID=3031301 RepID=A0ABT7DYH1_9NEIS|nr:TonB-dependent receptor [Parachitinimonas caeni]MDK2124118.1 TonB-dependent receptor [Parachitinimonas caeni]